MTLSPRQLDVLIIGAGFSGIIALYKVRQLGFSVKIYERGSSMGGTWFYNRYPGARVDSESPVYQFSAQSELWESFNWTERFPGRDEILRYFAHADKKLDLSSDIEYNWCVVSANFDDMTSMWNVTMQDGSTSSARYLILCTGFGSVTYTPKLRGLANFRGEYFHSNRWPTNNSDDSLSGKRVAIIGTGASGVQIIQAIGPFVKQLTVYQRTPNLALPMRQRDLINPDKNNGYAYPEKSEYPEMFKNLRNSFGAVIANGDFVKEKYADTAIEDRHALYELAWTRGGFNFWLGTYVEIFFNQAANDEVYAFWRDKVRARISDPVKRDLLAPIIPPHAFGTKRPSLEETYYEVMDQNNVAIVDLESSPIVEIMEEGIKTEKEGVIPVDVIIFATGFDAVSGGITNIKITNSEGLSIQEKWRNGLTSHLGMGTHGFPNMFWIYGPQAPTAFANGPTCGELQGDWIAELLEKMRRDGNTRVEVEEKAEYEWRKTVTDLWNASLAKNTASWYQGANIPGKLKEPLCYFGGLPKYIEILDDCKADDYTGFNFN